MIRLLATRWRAARDARSIARRPIPDDLWRRTHHRYPFLNRRDPEDTATLRRLCSMFLDRKEFDARGNVRLTNDVVVAIAAQACLPVLRLGLHLYDGFIGIVVHPDAVVARREVTDDDGVAHVYDEVLAGEAMDGGPLMLSWRDVRQSGMTAAAGYNVVIHEFAHVLDMTNGASDGMPALNSQRDVDQWQETILHAKDELQARVHAAEPSAIDPYGCEGVDEFFAVATEAFFVSPNAMRRDYRRLYDLLCGYFQQDPAAELG